MSQHYDTDTINHLTKNHRLPDNWYTEHDKTIPVNKKNIYNVTTTN